jgi:hypothetical protein
MKIMCDLEPNQNVAQPSHQVMYLKNLIGDLVGLNHSVKFDPYSGLCYPSLLFLSQKDALQGFYNHINMKDMIVSIKEEINKNLSVENSLENLLVFLNDPENMHGNWIIEEDADNPLNMKINSITDIGVIRLFLKIKAFFYLIVYKNYLLNHI